MQKSKQIKIKNFDLLKENDNFLLSLKKFIKDYECFINFNSKSPENYLTISLKFKDFYSNSKGNRILPK